MKRFVLDHLSRECERSEQLVACKAHKDADMTVELASGKRIAVYVINRAIRLPEIKHRLETNTARRLHTLFIIDGRMMPSEQSEVEPPHWMAALHALTDGRVYAYWCEGREVTIRPVHMEWKWGQERRVVNYGPAVDVTGLRAHTAHFTSKYITGRYAAADFGDSPFWKKRPSRDEQPFRYSWRNWSFTGARRPRQEQDAEAWEPWDEFQRHYGDVGDYQYYDDQRKRRSSKRQSAGSRTYRVVNQHYQVLGLSSSASYDEVKRAYRLKARENHPDMHPHEKEKYTKRMAEINAAFEAISKEHNV